MKYFILLFTIFSFRAFASEVFTIEYQKGTSRYEEFRLSAKDGRKFELKKKGLKKEQKVELSFEAGKRLSELVTKLSFSGKSLPKCSVYLSFSLDRSPGRVCQEERERTRDAIQLMHHLATFF